MHSVLKFAFIAGLMFLVAAEVAYGQAQALSYGTSDPGIQQRMQSQEQRMKSDGNLTGQERQKLNPMQDRASDNSYRQKHDCQKANKR